MGDAMSPTKLVWALLIAGSLGACAATPETGQGAKENTGTAVGAIAGGLLGSTIGGLIGNRIGASMDDEDKRRAYAAQMQALESGQSGAPVTWKNPDTGRYGTIVPGPAYQQASGTCRQYTHTIYIDGKPQTARGAACRNPDGTWTPIS